MRRADHARRGAPLMMLATVIGVWVAYRAIAWEGPIFENAQPVTVDQTATPPQIVRRAAPYGSDMQVAMPDLQMPNFGMDQDISPVRIAYSAAQLAYRGGRSLGRSWATNGLQGRPPMEDSNFVEDASTPYPAAAFGIPSPVMASAAGVPQTANSSAQQLAPQIAAEFRQLAPSRWSGDAWALFRQGSDSALSALRPSYGRSQAGAVLRYDLAPGSSRRPQAYARATTALAGPRQRELAAGLSARPISSVPLRAHLEGRVFDTQFGTETRAAAFVVTELPMAELPGGFSAETYAQAGFVTGEFATPFVDGQVRVTRAVVQGRGFRVEAGAGAWGGAQEGTGRLDVGPTVSVTVPLGRVNARLAADYRFRVVGEAEPASGPALTLSAGF